MSEQRDIVAMESKQISTWLAGGRECQVIAEEDATDASGTVNSKMLTYRHPDGHEFKITLEQAQ